MPHLTHFDHDGNAHMVDVGGKEVTLRSASAKALVVMQPETLARVKAGTVKKGEVLTIAQLAGIMGAKRTADLIPLCHPLALSSVTVTLTPDEVRSAIEISATCKVTARTGVEMEALMAVSIAALTVYDMLKSADRGMRITEIRLVEKSGGKSGVYEAP